MQLSTSLTQMVIEDSSGEAGGGLNEKRIFNRGAEDRAIGGGGGGAK